MIKEDITEKMYSCRLWGTSCPHREEMKSQYPAPEKPMGAQIEFTNVAQMDKDAKHCIECEKYEALKINENNM